VEQNCPPPSCELASAAELTACQPNKDDSNPITTILDNVCPKRDVVTHARASLKGSSSSQAGLVQ